MRKILLLLGLMFVPVVAQAQITDCTPEPGCTVNSNSGGTSGVIGVVTLLDALDNPDCTCIKFAANITNIDPLTNVLAIEGGVRLLGKESVELRFHDSVPAEARECLLDVYPRPVGPAGSVVVTKLKIINESGSGICVKKRGVFSTIRNLLQGLEIEAGTIGIDLNDLAVATEILDNTITGVSSATIGIRDASGAVGIRGNQIRGFSTAGVLVTGALAQWVLITENQFAVNDTGIAIKRENGGNEQNIFDPVKSFGAILSLVSDAQYLLTGIVQNSVTHIEIYEADHNNFGQPGQAKEKRILKKLDLRRSGGDVVLETLANGQKRFFHLVAASELNPTLPTVWLTFNGASTAEFSPVYFAQNDPLLPHSVKGTVACKDQAWFRQGFIGDNPWADGVDYDNDGLDNIQEDIDQNCVKADEETDPAVHNDPDGDGILTCGANNICGDSDDDICPWYTNPDGTPLVPNPDPMAPRNQVEFDAHKNNTCLLLCDADPDGDGIPNGGLDLICGNADDDNCPNVANPGPVGQRDWDGDGEGDVCQDDEVDPVTGRPTGDGVMADRDNCPFDKNVDQANLDRDLTGDICDPDDDNDGISDSEEENATSGEKHLDPRHPDTDRDGVCDGPGFGFVSGDRTTLCRYAEDNCPYDHNPYQTDRDEDEIGDTCDADPATYLGPGTSDSDRDVYSDGQDNCPHIANTSVGGVQPDLDRDRVGDACDSDDDNDNIDDVTESGIFVLPNGTQRLRPGVDDQDGDGLTDADDNCETLPNANQRDNDNDGKGDACDNDDDNDGLEDKAESEDLHLFSWLADSDRKDGELFRNGDGKCDGPTEVAGLCRASDPCPQFYGDGANSTCARQVSPNLASDEDDDKDGVKNAEDNCPLIRNIDQRNMDGDEDGDVCDEDKDGDGCLNANDINENVASADCALPAASLSDNKIFTGGGCSLSRGYTKREMLFGYLLVLLVSILAIREICLPPSKAVSKKVSKRE